MRFTGKVAIVTGASRGIGFSIAQRLISEGCRVAVTARKEETLAEAVTALGGPEVALGVPGRADDPDHRAETVRRVTEQFGPVDVLINNAGINPAYGPLLDVDLGVARKTLEVNLLGSLAWVQDVCRAGMLERGGSIVNISSVSAVLPAPGIAFYGVSKAALSHLTACLAVELGPTVRINAVAPAVVKTKFATALYAGREDEVSANYPLRRLGVPEDISGAVAFLASSEADWLTGQTVVIDGGMSLAGGVGQFL